MILKDFKIFCQSSCDIKWKLKIDSGSLFYPPAKSEFFRLKHSFRSKTNVDHASPRTHIHGVLRNQGLRHAYSSICFHLCVDVTLVCFASRDPLCNWIEVARVYAYYLHADLHAGSYEHRGGADELRVPGFLLLPTPFPSFSPLSLIPSSRLFSLQLSYAPLSRCCHIPRRRYFIAVG